MKRSRFLTINWRDFLKGLLLSVISAVITLIYNAIQSGVTLDAAFFKQVGIVAVTTLLAYLAKNLFENSEGNLALEK